MVLAWRTMLLVMVASSIVLQGARPSLIACREHNKRRNQSPTVQQTAVNHGAFLAFFNSETSSLIIA